MTVERGGPYSTLLATPTVDRRRASRLDMRLRPLRAATGACRATVGARPATDNIRYLMAILALGGHQEDTLRELDDVLEVLPQGPRRERHRVLRDRIARAGGVIDNLTAELGSDAGRLFPDDITHLAVHGEAAHA